MKSIFSLLLLVTCQFCPGQTDTNVIAVGDWSAAVSDGKELRFTNTSGKEVRYSGPALRGRLLIYDDRDQSANNHARVYLELQHIYTTGWDQPVDIYYDPDWTNVDLHLDMRDEHDQPIPKKPVFIWGAAIEPCWVTLPCDATIRLRADLMVGPAEKPDGLEILVNRGCWIIPRHATNDFYLSGTFSPPSDLTGPHEQLLSPLNYRAWHGTLNLPKVKIPSTQP